MCCEIMRSATAQRMRITDSCGGKYASNRFQTRSNRPARPPRRSLGGQFPPPPRPGFGPTNMTLNCRWLGSRTAMRNSRSEGAWGRHLSSHFISRKDWSSPPIRSIAWANSWPPNASSASGWRSPQRGSPMNRRLSNRCSSPPLLKPRITAQPPQATQRVRSHIFERRSWSGVDRITLLCLRWPGQRRKIPDDTG